MFMYYVTVMDFVIHAPIYCKGLEMLPGFHWLAP